MVLCPWNPSARVCALSEGGVGSVLELAISRAFLWVICPSPKESCRLYYGKTEGPRFEIRRKKKRLLQPSGIYSIRYSPLTGGALFLSTVCRSYRCMEGFMIRGWFLILAEGRYLHEIQVSVSTSWGRNRPVRSPFSSTVCQSCKFIEASLVRRCAIHMPGWRWLHEHQDEVSTQWGRYRQRRPPISSPVCPRCKCRKVCTNWG